MSVFNPELVEGGLCVVLYKKKPGVEAPGCMFKCFN